MSGGAGNADFDFRDLPNELASLIWNFFVTQLMPARTYMGRSREWWADLADHWPPGLMPHRERVLTRAWWEFYGPTTTLRPNLAEAQTLVPAIWAWIEANQAARGLWWNWQVTVEREEGEGRAGQFGLGERDYSFWVTLQADDDEGIIGQFRGPTHTWYQDPPDAGELDWTAPNWDEDND